MYENIAVAGMYPLCLNFTVFFFKTFFNAFTIEYVSENIYYTLKAAFYAVPDFFS